MNKIKIFGIGVVAILILLVCIPVISADVTSEHINKPPLPTRDPPPGYRWILEIYYYHHQKQQVKYVVVATCNEEPIYKKVIYYVLVTEERYRWVLCPIDDTIADMCVVHC